MVKVKRYLGTSANSYEKIFDFHNARIDRGCYSLKFGSLTVVLSSK